MNICLYSKPSPPSRSGGSWDRASPSGSAACGISHLLIIFRILILHINCNWWQAIYKVFLIFHIFPGPLPIKEIMDWLIDWKRNCSKCLCTGTVWFLSALTSCLVSFADNCSQSHQVTAIEQSSTETGSKIERSTGLFAATANRPCERSGISVVFKTLYLYTEWPKNVW